MLPGVEFLRSAFTSVHIMTRMGSQNCLAAMQDGSIGFNIQLTGELSTSLLSPGEEEGPKWGTLVAPRVNAQVHVQHSRNLPASFAPDVLVWGPCCRQEDRERPSSGNCW